MVASVCCWHQACNETVSPSWETLLAELSPQCTQHHVLTFLDQSSACGRADGRFSDKHSCRAPAHENEACAGPVGTRACVAA